MSGEQHKKALGRGLSALLSEIGEPVGIEGRNPATTFGQQMLPIENVHPNPNQPRRSFDQSALEELASSIRSKGVLQPLIVRSMGEGENYQIVAGERRWRASQMAGLHLLPVLVRDLSDHEVLEIAIIENIQRADLNAIEEAAGYHQLLDRFGHTQERLAEALGRSRSHIANMLRLLTLPEDVLALVREDRLSAGHARALVGCVEPIVLARRIVDQGLSVRDAEKLAAAQKHGPAKDRAPAQRRDRAKDADTRALEGDLSAGLKMSVNISHEPGTGRGTLTVTYNSLEDLDFLCQTLSGVDRNDTF